MRSKMTNMVAGMFIAACASFGFDSALAQYPERPVKLIVPYPAGGGADVISRLYGMRLETKLGQPVVVENVAGAAGALGAQRVANATADGYTLLIGGNAELLIRTLLQPGSHDVFRDFTPISLIGTGPMVVLGRPTLPASTLAEVIELARSKPGALSFGSGAQGTPMHLIGEAIKSKAGVDIRFIPYRGAPPTLVDLTAGHIDLGIVTLAAALPLIRSGKVRPYAVSSLQRVEFAPNIPALSETSELAGFALDFWAGLFGPANLPASIKDKLAALTVEVLDDPDLKARLAEQVFAVRKLSGYAFNAFIAAEHERAKKIIEDGQITLAR